EISEAIVSALRLKLLPAEKSAIGRRGTDNADAYNLYLMSLRHSVRGNSDLVGHEELLRLARRAVGIDPAYAQAWALMALAQTTLHFRHGASEDGLAAAERALSLDPNLAEPHAVKARHLDINGRPDEVEAEIELALRLDPESYDVNFSAAFIRFRQQRLAEAIRYFEAATRLSDTSFGAPGMLVTCYAALGDAQGVSRNARLALERAERAIEDDQSNGQAMGMGASALAALGDHARAREWIARALLIDPDNRSMRYNLVCALSFHLGDVEGANDLLEPYLATATHSELQHAAVDPDLDPLRGDPRFKRMVAEAQARVAASR
ncbi:MAG: hypothetical protein ACHP7A_09845, partial [Caulobacterales bacterium]